MSKKWPVLLILLLSLLAANGVGAEEASESANLIFNADLLQADEDGNPEGWYSESYDSGNSQFKYEQTDTGEMCLYVFNYDTNDARWVQLVDVLPNTTYHISCLVRTADMENTGNGANLSVLNSFTGSNSVFDTNGEWVPLDLYGTTGADETSLYLAARLGGYSAMGTGKAWFKGFSMTPVDAVPAGFTNQSLATNAPVAQSPDTKSNEPIRYTAEILLAAFVFILIGLSVYTQMRRNMARTELLAAPGKPYLHLAILLGIALVVRVFAAWKVRGYNVDITDFEIWSETMANNGYQFYNTTSFCDYPPVYMILLGLIGLVRQLFQIANDSLLHQLLIKSIPILSDLVAAMVLYKVAKPRLGERNALLLAGVYVLSPAVIADSAAWGQVDGLLALLLALVFLKASQGKWHYAVPLFALAILTKPQAILFAPLGLVAVVIDCVQQGRKNDWVPLRRALIGLAIALAGVYAIAAPFAMYDAGIAGKNMAQVIVSPVSWLVRLYSGTFGGYRNITVNACNLYQLLNKNWVHMADTPLLSVVSWVLFALSYLYAALLCISGKRKHLLLIGAVLGVMVFALGPMMHERYLFVALLLAALAFAHERDTRIFIGMLLIMAVQFANIALVLQGGLTSEYAGMGHLQSSEQGINALLSVITLLAMALFAWTGFDICVRGKSYPIKSASTLPAAPRERLLQTNDAKLHLRARDWLLMLGVTAIYSVAAFTNLGSTKAPQTFLASSEYQESVVFDLGQVRTFHMTYYGGICDSNFTVSLSNDGTNWTEESYAEYEDGTIFRWLWFSPRDEKGVTLYESSFVTASPSTAAQDTEEVVWGEDTQRVHKYTGEAGAAISYATSATIYPMQTARYVRITAQAVGLTLGEFGFLDADGVCYPIVAVSGQNGAPEADYTRLIDEQDTVPAAPSYYNGTYFDEIYHARTAYEFLHGMSTYEWTHPPLGKVIMMIGIQLFGMTPFGWRFMGALTGVLMLPLLYLLIKQLTKRTDLSLIGMFLMAVDSMHFTQTRIATIDSYAVFFIMLMYLFMIRYVQMNFNRDSFRRTLIPLGLCGVSMGLAWATKWIGIYGSVGLAVLLFVSLGARLREYCAARRETEIADADQTCAHFWRKVIITLAFCIVFFVLIPLAIYYFSYFWQTAPQGGLSLKRVFDTQISMYKYHTGLSGDTHYFRSPWYEWPVIAWPMWFYSGSTEFIGKGVVSSISCMGNPAVWWVGLGALVFLLIRLVLDTRPSKSVMITLIAFASQFLPWVLVPRSTFIYHYFASVPFLIILIVLMLNELRKKDPRAMYITAGTLMAVALVLFIAFYPLESGALTSYEYALKLRWFKWYNFALQN